MIWWAALLIGLTGSLHCAGMCSPIALMIPISKERKIASFLTLTVYNIGRTITYVLLGFLVGFFAKGMDLTGLQNYFSIFMGVFLVIVFLFSINVEGWLANLSFYRKVNQFISKGMKWAYQSSERGHQKNPFLSALTIGLANGLLPCGLVYLAIAGALTTAGPKEGMIFMAFFGLGTFPMMTFIPIFVKSAGQKFRFQARQYIPYLLLLMAAMFIYRGMEMGDMFSPIINAADPSDSSCAPK
ncbi:MAG TPA: sulfite exporter TauE/SafE family protein [Saprospiraceae bacterium]|nr:sulfite exporter TauE/SafE family protein [Saprospiraceae bacterium]